jgi:hypothetical protein
MAPHIEGLVGVIHQGGHLAETAAQQFLDVPGDDWVLF